MCQVAVCDRVFHIEGVAGDSTTVVGMLKWPSSGMETDAEEGQGNECQRMGRGTKPIAE